MCGIVGAISPQDLTGPMREAMRLISHRGPDGQGVYSNASEKIHLGHLRLAILDLTPTGAQPMESHDGRWVMVFNGEIYNFHRLKNELTNVSWRGSSDTEVLLEGISRWGVKETLKWAHGMFAIAAYDRKERKLWLARDRFGEKPLYVAHQNGVTSFASESQALAPFFKSEINRDALADYMKLGYIPAPQTVWNNCWKLPQGTFVSIDVDKPAFDLADCAHYDPIDFNAKSKDAGDDSTIADFEKLLDAAVGRQMVSDVPLGGFLSGGIDSTLIVTSMLKHSKKVRTFTLGIDGQPADESIWAKKIAQQLGTQHDEFRVSVSTIRDHLLKVAACYDEPFADPSQIPTWIVSQMARRHVTVCLSGDAGDELFGGYANYQRIEKLRKLRPFLPLPLVRFFSDSEKWNSLDKMTGPYSGHKIRRALRVLSQPDYSSQFEELTAHTYKSSIVGGAVSRTQKWPRMDRLGAQWQDVQRYLPDDILVKTDRASMSHGLEARVPLLDPELFKWVWALPDRYKVRNGETKWLMKTLLRQRLPKELIDRPKQGFGLPLQKWIAHDLRDLIRATLDKHKLDQQGIFQSDVVLNAIDQHERGSHDNKSFIWNAFMLQIWLDRTKAASPSDR